LAVELSGLSGILQRSYEMTRIAALFCVSVMAGALLLVGCGADDGRAVRIGTYDSRSVALAYWTGARLDAHHEATLAAKREAEAAGDQRRAQELEAEVWAHRKQTHRQVFSTAPVDDVLEHVEGKLPEIMRQAGVERIVSKWDKETLAEHPSARLVDITPQLVGAFDASPERRRQALEIRSKRPVSPEEMEKHLSESGH
jgi:hypothetical protein